MSSRRVTLGYLRDGRLWCSFAEGEFGKPGGLRIALREAERMSADARTAEQNAIYDGVAVASFGVALDRMRLIKAFPWVGAAADVIAKLDAERESRAAEGDGFLPPQSVIDELVKDCRCCDCTNKPCDAVMAGGVCDELCVCELSDDTRPEDRCAPIGDEEDATL